MLAVNSRSPNRRDPTAFLANSWLGDCPARPDSSGFIEVRQVSTGDAHPITIARGTQSGPTLALIAGTHGSESRRLSPCSGCVR